MTILTKEDREFWGSNLVEELQNFQKMLFRTTTDSFKYYEELVFEGNLLRVEPKTFTLGAYINNSTTKEEFIKICLIIKETFMRDLCKLRSTGENLLSRVPLYFEFSEPNEYNEILFKIRCRFGSYGSKLVEETSVSDECAQKILMGVKS